MKNTKIAALVAAAALLVIGAAFTSFAATYNWYTDDAGIWHCKDKNDDDIFEDTAKSGNDTYYLDENGEMVADAFIEIDGDYYYFDVDGKMVKNQWEKIENEDDDEDADEYNWYYFTSNGKAKKQESPKPYTIGDAKYMFDSEGKMLYGWIDVAGEEDLYYCGEADDGAVKSGWQLIEVEDEDGEKSENWYYFASGSKKVYAKNGDDVVEKSINGKKYAFDEDGVMQSEWVKTATAGDADKITSYKWFKSADDGSLLKKGWFRNTPQEDVNFTDNEDGVEHWFYANNDGSLAKSCIKSINGKKYAFNEKGEMISGLVIAKSAVDGEGYEFTKVTTEQKVAEITTVGATEQTIYFFGDEETDGAMKTGAVTTTIDGEEYTFTFEAKGATDKGKAIYGLSGNYYYVNGKKIVADEDMKYTPYLATFETKEDGTVVKVKTLTAKGYEKNASCLISASGSIVKNGTKKDADGYKYTVKNYVVTGKE